MGAAGSYIEVRSPGELEDLRPGDRIEYLCDPVFDLLIICGDRGRVVRMADDWVFAAWERTASELSVPIASVRRASD